MDANLPGESSEGGPLMSSHSFRSLSSSLSRLLVVELQAGDLESAAVLVRQLAALWAYRFVA